ncbi:FecCD family ABC transporter permease [Tindallia californiensis]|uniref:Iron complex transport system permease protein n=1 Tax=Tindallia californiensis TaxID=159292 RepID=A0A1H3I9F3_9FIRM|nr:iron chelate uptake ABC transporter family permease subunit [Tindallia californiensis]SDY24356.1 iron complex transport system permease protein [Tindallia californiensis]
MKLLSAKSYFYLMIPMAGLAIITASSIGAANISILEGFQIVMAHVPYIKDFVNIDHISDAATSIIIFVRLPRVLLAFLVGLGLSVVGVSMQGMLRNPLADPYIIGTSSGAALGASLAIVLKLNHTFIGFGMVSVFAFLGALLSTGIVYQLARRSGKVPTTTLLLAGIATGQFFSAALSFIMVIASRDVSTIVYWTMGSFSARGWHHVSLVIVPMVLGTFFLIFHSKDLNLLLIGEETAQNTGVNVEKVKISILIISTLITAFAVSVSGIIGFVGLIIPHITRVLIGPNHRVLIPACGLLGGIFLVTADTFSRTIIAPTELPVGIITALAGAPFFVYLLRKARKIE